MPLPKIIQILMYHGGEYWSQPRAFGGLIDAPGSLGSEEPYPIRLMHVLDDVSEVSSDVLRDTATIAALSKLVSMCFKRAPTRTELLKILGRWMAVVREVAAAPNGLESMRRVIIYILQVNEYVEPEALKAHLEGEIGRQSKEAITTAGQRLIEQGRQEGHQEALLHLLRQRFGDEVDAQIEQRVTAASVEQLQAWIARVLSASTLTELLVD
jgi:hypothetical protein